MKKIGKILMYVLLVCMLNFQVSAENIKVEVSGIEGGEIVFDTQTGTIVSASVGIKSANIPTSIEGYAVIYIGDYAFSSCDELTSVTMPNTVLSIGKSAFQSCENLTRVSMTSSIKEIKSSAFQECSSLVSITIPNSVGIIDDAVFKDCTSLKTVTIVSSSQITSIGNLAFANCENLTNLTYQSNLASIGDMAFANCKSLENVRFSNTTTVIGKYAFAYCKSLKSVSLSNNVTSIGVCAFAYCENLTSITIPTSLQEIETGVFGYCKSITNITIPSSVTSLGNNAFSNCDALNNVSIPTSVISVGDDAFGDCNSLESVNYAGTKEQWNQINMGSGNTDLTMPYITTNLSTTKTDVTELTSAIQFIPYTTKVPAVTGNTFLESGNLPTGLGLFPDGTISGIPTKSGTYIFTLSNGNSHYIVVSLGTDNRIDLNNDYEILDKVPTITTNENSQEFHIDGEYSKFKDFYLNGNKLTKNVDYTAKEGSTRITILSQTIALMPAGNNTISATFEEEKTNEITQVSQIFNKTSEQEEEILPYTDVNKTDWFYSSVNFVYNREIIKGTSDTTYSPSGIMTRAMMVDALYQLAGTPTVKEYKFDDVDSKIWYANAVSWAANTGITQGTHEGLFSPDRAVTREEMATLLNRYCEELNVSIPLVTSAEPVDISAISDWAKESAGAMFKRGVLSGDAQGNFNPSNTAIRAEASSMFANLVEILERTTLN